MSISESIDVDVSVTMMKKIEVQEQYGWQPIEFENVTIGDTIRVIEGHPTEVGRVFHVVTEPQRCEPKGNWCMQCDVVEYGEV